MSAFKNNFCGCW